MIRSGLTKLQQQGGGIPVALSSRRKRKHLDVEFEPAKQNKEQETKELKELETVIKKDFYHEHNNKLKLWLSQAEKITEFRNANKGAPVDDYGAEAIPEGTGENFRYQTLVSLMLSSQTRDQVTAKAVQNLKTKLNGGLTVESMRKAKEETIAELIKPVSFYSRKASYLQRTAELLATKYKGDIPSTLDGLLELPGVGPKMAYLCMQHAWDKCIGIGVDVHVHRISNRLGWVKTNKPEDTRKELEGWLPKEKWSSINLVLVGFGQTHCLPIGPKCATCVVNDTCPTGIVNIREQETKKKKKQKKKTGDE